MRGQRAIVKSDFLNFAKIITNPDEIYLGDKKFENKPVIIFVKTINGKTTAVTYVSAKHHDLTLQTMYSGKNKESLATTPSENKSLSQTSETLSGTASYKILAHEDNKVNIKENDNVSDIKYATDDTINDWLDDDFFFTLIRYLYIPSVRSPSHKNSDEPLFLSVIAFLCYYFI